VKDSPVGRVAVPPAERHLLRDCQKLRGHHDRGVLVEKVLDQLDQARYNEEL